MPIETSKVQWDEPAAVDSGKVQWDPAPEQEADSPGLIGAAVRGFKRSLPETKSLVYGAGAAVAGAVGAEGLRDRALSRYREITQDEVAPQQGPSFQDVREGKAGVGEYVGDVVGNFGGQAVQSGAVALAGAAAGSEVPGVGNLAGAVGGVLARGAVKKAITTQAERMLANQVAKGAVKEGAEQAARQVIERKLTRQLGAGAASSYGLNAAQEAGISYTGRADDAAAAGQDLTQADATRALGFGAVSGAVDTAAEGLAAGRLFRGASGSPSITRRLLAGATKGSLTEGGTEAAQAVLERAGASQSLTDDTARNDYLENFVAGAVGGGVLGAGGGARRRVEAGDERGQETAPAAEAAAPAAAAVPPLSPDAGPLERVAHDASTSGARDELFAAQMPAQQDQAQSAVEYRLPPPPWVDTTTGAIAATPDLATAKAYVHEQLTRMEAAGEKPLNRAAWKRELGISDNLLANTIIGEVKAERAKGLTAPAERRSDVVARLRAGEPATENDRLMLGASELLGPRDAVRLYAELLGEEQGAAAAPVGAIPAGDDGKRSTLAVMHAAQAALRARSEAANGPARAVAPESGAVESGGDLLAGLAGQGDAAGAGTAEAVAPEVRGPQVPQTRAAQEAAPTPAPRSDEPQPDGRAGAAALAQEDQPVGPSAPLASGSQTADTTADDADRSGSSQTAGQPSAIPEVAGEGDLASLEATPAPAGDQSAATGANHPKQILGFMAKLQEDAAKGIIHGKNGNQPAARRSGTDTAIEGEVVPPTPEWNSAKMLREQPVGHVTTIEGPRTPERPDGGVRWTKQAGDVWTDGRNTITTERLARIVDEVPEAPAIEASTSAAPALHAAAHAAATSPQNDLPLPTEAQKEAGNYAKGHHRIAGLDVSIENPAGSRRRPEWPPLKDHYGYIRGSVGADKDHVDVFLTKDAEDTSRPVFVVDQVNKDGSFDEHKVVMGAAIEADARKAYLRNYAKGWTGLGGITQMTQDQFKTWVKDPAQTKRPLTPLKRGTIASKSQHAPRQDLPAPDKNDPQFDDKNVLRQLRNGLLRPASASGNQWTPASVASVEQQIERLQSKIKRATIDGAFAENRKAIIDKNLRKGDTVTWTENGATVTGTILNLGDKEQGVVAVGRPGRNGGIRDSHVGARELNKAPPAGHDIEQKHPAPKAKAHARKVASAINSREIDSKSIAAPSTEDAGEELWYNRRNRTGAGLQWRDIEGLNATLKSKEAVKSKVWPRPDYASLVDDGLHPALARVLKMVYDSIGAKPGTRAVPTDQQLQQYVEGVGKVRDATFAWVQRLNQPEARKAIDLQNGVALTPLLSESRLIDDIFPGQNSFRFTGESGKANNQLAFLLGGNKLVQAIQVNQADFSKAFREVKAGWPAAQEAWQRLYQIREMGGSYRVSRAGRYIARDLASRADAEATAKAHYEEQLKKRGTDKGQMAEESIAVQEAVRTGAARRAPDEDVSSEQLKDAFGFRGINFGNWMKGKAAGNARERQLHLNQTYDAFHDLAEILGIPPKALSLDGMLGIAFGAQGSGGGAAAHFVPGVNEINLTRKAGVGALAHEWGHALDHYFAVQAGDAFAKRQEPFLSHIVDGAGKVDSQSIRPEIVSAFRSIVSAMTRRPQTEADRTAANERMRARAQSSLDGWLKFFRTKLEETAKPAEKGRALEEFDQLAVRMRAGDLGEGYVVAPGSPGGFRPAVAAVRNLFKDAAGRAPSPKEMNSLSANAVHVAHALEQRTDDQSHVPQTTSSDYLSEARRLDASKTGMKQGYWTMRTELLARAFQSYVLDRLAQRDARNDYLTRPQMDEATAKVAKDMGLISGDRYPRGAEREAINAAFDALAGEFKTKETERGVALFSKAPPAPFKDQVGDRLQSQDPRGPMLDAGRSAAVLRMLQVPDLPMRMPGNVLFKVAGGKGGTRAALTEQQIARLPELIDDPVAVFRDPVRPDNLLVLTSIADADGKPVVIAVRPDGVDRYERVNVIVSAFGREDAKNWLERVAPHLLYRGDKANPRLSLSGLDQRQTDEGSAEGSARKVLGPEDLRKFRAASRAALTSRDAGTPATGGISLARAKQLRTELTANWGENQPSIRLVESSRELPADVRGDPDAERIEGLYNGSPMVWLNLGRIRTEKRFGEVLAHEVVGHYGVERVVGAKDWGGIVDAIERVDRSGTASQQLREIFADVRRRQPEAAKDRELFAKEAIAFMAERGIRNSWVNRVVAAVRRFLRKVMPTMRWTESDVRDLLGQSDSFLRRSRTPGQRRAMVRQYAFSTDDTPAYGESGYQVDELPIDDAFVAGMTPAERKSPAMASLARALWSSLGTDSPFFRDWFGDSKVVDKDGAPLKVYHGTADEFHAFDPARAGKSTGHMTARLGMFFDARRDKAQHYAEIASGGVPAEQNVLELYLSIKNPYPMAKSEFIAIDGTDTAAALRARLEREGYDGIRLPEIGQWIAFRADQVKATDNRGTFDKTDNRLLFSRAPADVLDDVTAVMDATQREGVVARARAALRDAVPAKAKDQLRTTWLGALATRHLTELGGDYFKNIRHYSDFLAEMGADRNQLQQEGEAIAEHARKWAGKHRGPARQLFDLMHDATIDGVDPAEEFQPLQFRYSGQLHEATRKNVKEAIAAIREQMRGRSADNKTDLIAEAKTLKGMPARDVRRRQKYPGLVERWNQLSPEAKDIYRQFRDAYKARSEAVEEALVARINDTDVPKNHKDRVIAIIRNQFETQRLQGVYFPLQRHGRFFVAAEKDDTPAFLMFDRLSDLESAVRDLKGRGFKINAQGLKSAGKAQDAPSGTFVAEIIQSLQKAGVSDKTQDEIYQLYLQTLPELSMRKHAIHRQSVPGFDPDAVRAFAWNMHHGAHQLARLRFGHKLQAVLDLLKQQQNASRQEEGADTRRIAAGDAVLGELEKRHEWIMNPQDSQATSLVSSFGFIYYLGLTPAAALVNLSQTALVSYPYLASRYGGIKAMNFLLAGMRDSIRTGGHIQRTLTDADEQRAHAYLQKAGALDKTQAHNLAGIAEGGLTGYNPAWARAMEIIGWGFHKTEVVNREATGMAAFRLAKAEGKGFNEAVRAAVDAINDTHFDYTNQNRARFMQGGTAKVLLMFRQYSLNMTWHMGRMVWQATKGESPAVRKLARRNLTGLLGMSALFSGALGLPLMSVTMGVLNAIAASFGDDDEPWDAETEFRGFLSDMLGPDVASVVLGGAVNPATGADVASRVSLSQLWFRDADRDLDGRGAYYNLLEQAAGPMGGVLKNALVGKQLMDDGHLLRGVETVLPKAMKDAMRAARYAREGVNTLRGDPLVPDTGVRETLLQLIGFTPSKVADRYDTNRALKNYEQFIIDRRSHLIDAYAMAQRLGDNDARRETMSKIRGFNRANPEVAITFDTIRRSLGQRARYSARAEGGITLDRRLARRVREAVGD